MKKANGDAVIEQPIRNMFVCPDMLYALSAYCLVADSDSWLFCVGRKTEREKLMLKLSFIDDRCDYRNSQQEELTSLRAMWMPSRVTEMTPTLGWDRKLEILSNDNFALLNRQHDRCGQGYIQYDAIILGSDPFTRLRVEQI